jgi:hypothetical protein
MAVAGDFPRHNVDLEPFFMLRHKKWFFLLSTLPALMGKIQVIFTAQSLKGESDGATYPYTYDVP